MIMTIVICSLIWCIAAFAVCYFLIREIHRLNSFIMAQNDSVAHSQSLWKPWDTIPNVKSTTTQAERDKQDFMALLDKEEIEEKDIERFGQTLGEVE